MSDKLNLVSCPLCGGDTGWCDGQENEDQHECHMIVCVGKCKTSFDCGLDYNPDELWQLKMYCANVFNERGNAEK